MGAQEKTNKLIRISNCPLNMIVKNAKNPNKMRPKEFDLLCDNMNTTGWTDPILVRPLDMDKLSEVSAKEGYTEKDVIKFMEENSIQLRIVGGHHRYDAASYLGFETGPVTVIMNPDFDDEMETFQVIRMNAIHGKLDPASFMDMLGDLSNKYADDVLQEMFGFADDAEFKRLTKQMAKTLPDQTMQAKFTEAAKEIKTIDGLANLLNHMFTTYGNTLPHGYMVFDYGGQKSIWLQSSYKTIQSLEMLGVMCIENQRSMDDIIGEVLQMMAAPDGQGFMKSIIENTPSINMPKGMTVKPTKDNLQQMGELG